MIERLRVRIPAGETEEFSSPELTLCADSYSVSVPPRVTAALRKDPWPNEVEMGWLCRCPGIVWEPIRKRAHTQLVRKHSVTVVSARWATVDWSWPKEWNKCAGANLHFRRGMNCRTFSHNPRMRGRSYHHHHHHSCVLLISTSFFCLFLSFFLSFLSFFFSPDGSVADWAQSTN